MNLSELRWVEQAHVFKKGKHAATLTRKGGGIVFGYNEGWPGPALATTLPLGASPRTEGGAVPPFFAGLLPEGRRHTALLRAIKTSADDELSLLLGVGADTIGDVTVSSTPNRPQRTTPVPQALDRVQFSALFRRVIGQDPEDRVGLPGVQPKVSGGMISLPVTLAQVPFLLKLNPPEYPKVVENEAFFLGAAREAGLRVPDFEVVFDANGESGLLVSRFDRGPTGPQAQEDACQVLQKYPADKYRVSSEQVITGLAQQCGAPMVAARELLKQVAFAVLMGNGDAHAKNFSIQKRDGEWHPTPAYDLVCTQVYGDHTLALPINGRLEDVGYKDFLALGAAVGLRERAVKGVLTDLLARSGGWVQKLDELPFDPKRILSCEQPRIVFPGREIGDSAPPNLGMLKVSIIRPAPAVPGDQNPAPCRDSQAQPGDRPPHRTPEPGVATANPPARSSGSPR